MELHRSFSHPRADKLYSFAIAGSSAQSNPGNKRNIGSNFEKYDAYQ